MALLTNHKDDRVDLDGVDFAGAGAQGRPRLSMPVPATATSAGAERAW
jgi:hypothetical protein